MRPILFLIVCLIAGITVCPGQVVVPLTATPRGADKMVCTDGVPLIMDLKHVYRAEADTFRLLFTAPEPLRIVGTDQVSGETLISVGETRFGGNETDESTYLAHGDRVSRIDGVVGRLAHAYALGGDLWLSTTLGAFKVSGLRSVRIPNTSLASPTIDDIAGHRWIWSFEEVYRVDGQKATKIQGLPSLPMVKRVFKLGDAVWVETEPGSGGDLTLFRIDGDHANRVAQHVLNLIYLEGTVWVTSEDQSSSGQLKAELYRITGRSAELISGLPGPADTIYRFAGSTFALVTNKIYRIDSTPAMQVGSLPSRPERSFRYGPIINRDAVWAIAGGAVYRIRGAEVQQIPDTHLEDPQLLEVGEQVWIADRNHLYLPDGNGLSQVTGLPSPIDELISEDSEDDEGKRGSVKHKDVSASQHRLWAVTEDGVYVMKGGRAERIIEHPHNVSSSLPNNDRRYEFLSRDSNAWFVELGSGNLYRLDGYTAKLILGISINEAISVFEAGGRSWIRSSAGIFRLEGDTARKVLNNRFSVVYGCNSQLLLYAISDWFRFHDDVSLDVELFTDSWWTSIIHNLSPSLFVSGILKARGRYRAKAEVPTTLSSAKPSFSVILTTDASRFHMALEDGSYVRIEDTGLPLDSGFPTIYVSIRDQWGNTSIPQPNGLNTIVIPSAGALAFAVPAITMAVLFALAPVSEFCHDVLMNPYFRKYASFGMIPLALTTSPPLRRYILRRYRRSLARDVEFEEWKTRYVLPASSPSPSKLGELLQEHRKLFLLGESGVGKTSYLKYLTVSYATKAALAPRKAIPVFLPLSRLDVSNAKQLFLDRLSAYGRIYDEKLAEWFLRQGGFIFLADGLNETSVTARGQFSTFVDGQSRANLFCVSSQERYTEFPGGYALGMPLLSVEDISSLLERRLDHLTAQRAIKSMTGNAFELYRLPQNLEFAVELLQRNEPLPNERLGLYKAVLAPSLNEWLSDGHGDYPALLFQRSFEMLCSPRDVFFEREKDPLPDEIGSALYTRRFLVKRAGRYMFRHDSVRAFLAAEYFAPEWRRLLAAQNTIDVNWRLMLEFSILKLDSSSAGSEIRDLLLLLLPKNPILAGELFTWNRQTKTSLCQSWSDEFVSAYGASMLSVVGTANTQLSAAQPTTH